MRRPSGGVGAGGRVALDGPDVVGGIAAESRSLGEPAREARRVAALELVERLLATPDQRLALDRAEPRPEGGGRADPFATQRGGGERGELRRARRTREGP